MNKYRTFFLAIAAYSEIATIGRDGCTIQNLHQAVYRIVAARDDLLGALGRAYTRSV